MWKAFCLQLLVVAVCWRTASAAENCKDSVAAEWDATGRTMTLLKDYKYVDPAGVEWLAPKGSIVDGASIPQFLWSLVGGPYEGKYRNASVAHDVECDKKLKPWRDVHRMFYNHMICSGVDPAKAKGMYWAVFECGPRWGSDQGQRLFPCGDRAQMRDTLASVECAVKGCAGSQIAVGLSGTSLDILEAITPAQWQQEPQVANLDLEEPVAIQIQAPIEYREEVNADIAPRMAVSVERTPSKVVFGRSQTTLPPGAADSLKSILSALTSDRRNRVLIDAHGSSDQTPSDRALVQARMGAVRSYFLTKGVAADQVYVNVSFRPASTNAQREVDVWLIEGVLTSWSN